MRQPVLPDFLVIGAAKCGTTSLSLYLDHHPDIAMSKPKETNFFAQNWHRGFEYYSQCFPPNPGRLLLGDASTSYSKAPLIADVPARVAATIPHAKLIYVIRHPIERIVSDFLHRLSQGRERSPWLDLSVFSNPWYLAVSRYGCQLDHYLEHFSRDQILVLRCEDLRARRQATVRQALRFIGADATVLPPNLATERNRADEKRRLDPRLDWPRRAWRGARVVTGKIPVRWRDRAERTFSRPIPSEASMLSPLTEARLWEALRPDLQRLREIVGPEFDLWGKA